jgi:hypothetical protein
MEVHLIDGTYELFRYFHALPSAEDREGREVAAVRGVVRAVLGMVTYGATHIGIATDHVIESFRTDSPLFEDVEALRWKGPTPCLDAMAAQLAGRGNPAVAARNLQPQAPE